MTLRFTAKLVGFGFAVFLLQVFLYAFMGAGTLPPEIVEMDRLLAQGVDVIYFGDSTVTALAPEDTDRRALGQMLQESLPLLEVSPLAHYAYHAEIYEAYCEYIRGGEQSPWAVVIPVNLRSFSLEWDRKPEWEFVREKYLLRHRGLVARSLLRPLTVFRAVDLTPISQEDYLKTPVYVGDALAGEVRDFETMGRDVDADVFYERQFAYLYQYPLNRDHPKLVALIRAIESLQAQDILPLLYITPIDYRTGEKYAGDAFAEQVAENVSLIRTVLAETGLQVLDLSRLLGPEAFCYQREVHEHLRAGGRKMVAERIARRIRISREAGTEQGRQVGVVPATPSPPR